jgi:DNA polymerase delta subunit 1
MCFNNFAFHYKAPFQMKKMKRGNENLNEALHIGSVKKHAPPHAPREYNVYDANELVHEEELLDLLDEQREDVDEMFRQDVEQGARVIAQRKAFKTLRKRGATERDLEDFYGEEDDDVEETADETGMDLFDPHWDYMHNQFLARGQQIPNGPREAHKRPPVLEGDHPNGATDYIFNLTEVTYGINSRFNESEIRLWGVDEAGHSCVTRIGGFNAYFYVAVDTEHEMSLIRPRLEAHLRSVTRPRQGDRPIAELVLSVEKIQGRTICGYHKNGPLSTMFKITLARPSLVSAARKCFDAGNRAVVNHSYETYEANVPYELRYMIDTDLHGCQWVTLRQGAYEATTEDFRISKVQFEFSVRHRNNPIAPIPINDKGTLGAMRILSYDIEVMRKEPGFPIAQKDPVVNICCALNVTGVGIVDRVVFVLRSHLPNGDRGNCNAIDGAVVYEYDDERHLLMAFCQYIQESDPDALTGWNTSSFDMPYLAERAKQNGIFDHFMDFSRVTARGAWLREQTFQSKAYGAKKSTELMCEGRFDYDGLIFMLRGQMKKYRSYSLNNIAASVLRDTKLDVDYSQIPLLFESDDDADRTRLAHYCLKDAELPLLILDKLQAVVNGAEQARVTGVPFKWLLSKGQGVKTFSNLLRHKEPHEYVPSVSPRSSTGDTAGGHVENPRRGFYPMPVITLDFSSLYPSIMIAHNICYSTKVDLEWARANLKEGDYWIPFSALDGGKTPSFCFVKKHIREGILPKLLAGLLDARRNVKGMMKRVDEELEAMLYSVLNGRQLALKVVCNSVYGFLKAFILRDKDLMSAVTSYGRNMLYEVKRVVAAQFQQRSVVDVAQCEALGLDPELVPGEGHDDPRPRTLVNGFIVYGDTDSVMVCFGYTGLSPGENGAGADGIKPVHVTLAELVVIGKEMAAKCTAAFEPPNALTFETIKLRGIWLNKKRYTALEIERFIEGERIADAIARGSISVKGLEGKRRDNALIGSATQNAIIPMLLIENDLAKVERFIVSRIQDLLMDRVDISELVITKGLSKTAEQYAKGGTKQQHVELQKKMRKRARYTGEVVPDTGDRVPYIVRASTNVAKTSKHAEKAYELAEHPLFAQKNKVPINTDYYLDKQIWPAVARILTGVYEPERCPDIESSMSSKKKETLEVYRRFFAPGLAHMRQKKRRKTGNFGIAAFTVVLPQCIGCGVKMPPKSTNPCCASCNVSEVKDRVDKEHAVQQERVKLAWDICRKCQGGSFEKVTCSNLTCKNFYHREQVLMDMEDMAAKLARW